MINFSMVKHGNKQTKANACNKKKQTTTKPQVFPKQHKKTNKQNYKKPEKGRSLERRWGGGGGGGRE